jgi:hypothetical protein
MIGLVRKGKNAMNEVMSILDKHITLSWLLIFALSTREKSLKDAVSRNKTKIDYFYTPMYIVYAREAYHMK